MSRFKLDRDGLNDKQARFVTEYLKDMNATQAAIRAGYSPKTAHVQGSALLNHPKVESVILRSKDKITAKAELTVEKIVDNIRRPVDGDVRKLFDEKGNLRPIHSLDDNEAALVAGFDTVTRNLDAADGKQDRIVKVRLVDRAKFVEMGARYHALFRDKVDVNVTGAEALVARLKAGRSRVARNG